MVGLGIIVVVYLVGFLCTNLSECWWWCCLVSRYPKVFDTVQAAIGRDAVQVVGLLYELYSAAEGGILRFEPWL